MEKLYWCRDIAVLGVIAVVIFIIPSAAMADDWPELTSRQTIQLSVDCELDGDMMYLHVDAATKRGKSVILYHARQINAQWRHRGGKRGTTFHEASQTAAPELSATFSTNLCDHSGFDPSSGTIIGTAQAAFDVIIGGDPDMYVATGKCRMKNTVSSCPQ